MEPPATIACPKVFTANERLEAAECRKTRTAECNDTSHRLAKQDEQIDAAEKKKYERAFDTRRPHHTGVRSTPLVAMKVEMTVRINCHCCRQ